MICLCSFAGYAPCLAASKTLHSAGILQEASPGKAGGQPGSAFSLVYGKVTDRVWDTVYNVDGVLGEWIRYSPGRANRHGPRDCEAQHLLEHDSENCQEQLWWFDGKHHFTLHKGMSAVLRR